MSSTTNPSPASPKTKTPTSLEANRHLLESFRQDWINEVNQRSKAAFNTNTPRLLESSPSPPLSPQAENAHASLDQSHGQDPLTTSAAVSKSSQATSLQEAQAPLYSYAHAVHYERLGLLDDALVCYRRAFKADPAVDRLYHQLDPQELDALEKLFDSLTQPERDGSSVLGILESSSSSRAGNKIEFTASRDPEAAFKFSRSMQTGEDYRMKGSTHNHTSHASTQAVTAYPVSLLADPKIKKTDAICREDTRDSSELNATIDQHPHSTRRLRQDLVASFKANPWVRPPSATPEQTATVEDQDSSVNGTLPILSEVGTPQITSSTSVQTERLLHDDSFIDMVSALSLDYQPSLPSSSQKGDQNLSTALNWYPNFEPFDLSSPCPLRLLPPELILQIFKPSLESKTTNSIHSHVILIEKFARVSRLARVLMFDDQLWKVICEETYARQFQKGAICRDPVLNICRRWHGGDWRRMYIEEPRVRVDGCFIALIRYPRMGESANPWYPPTYFVTYFRYLRFFPDGTCLNFSTTDDPGVVVRSFDKNLRAKGLSSGSWDLVGDLINIWDLEERATPLVHPKNRGKLDALPVVPPSNFQTTYKLQMHCRLKSTQRGKMNKLEILDIATINKRTHEVVQVPLTHSSPFFFSRVLAYESLTNANT